MASDKGLPDSGKYTIVRPLGRGGMGEVYLAHDTRLGRDVAIKYMRGDLPCGNWQERLKQEAQLLARINHPNIVQIYDIIESEGIPALVMEYVEGRNLHIHLREHRAELGEKLRWLSEIAAGLAASHAQGIAHCDLKAENVLVDSHGVAKITDFGIAVSGANMADDIAALGSLADTLLQRQGEQLSPVLKDLLRRLEHKNPAKRPDSKKTAESFRIAWHEHTQDETPLPEDLQRQAPYRKWLLGGIATALLALVAMILLLLPTQQRPNYVAVMPTTLTEVEDLDHQQRQLIQSTVQQSLQQAVIASDSLALISFVQSSAADGALIDIAEKLGADTLIASTLDCSKTTCELSLERIAGGAVSHQVTVTLLVDSYLESYDSVQRRWPHLFPEAINLRKASELISDKDYLRYLELHLALDQFDSPQQDIFEGLEGLLESAEQFAPVYQLYTQVGMWLYEDMGDTQYLDNIDRALDRAQRYLGDNLFLQRSWFELALRRENFELAQSTLEIIRGNITDDALLAYLEGELYFSKLDHGEAERHYRRAVSLHPTMQYYYARTRNLFFGNDLQAAAEVLDELLRRYPYHTSALGIKGLIAMERGDYELSISAFKQSLEIQPDPLQRSNLGTAYLMLGNYEAARDQFLIAYNRDSRDSVLVLNLADTEQLAGNHARATQLYRGLTARVESGDISVLPEVASQAYAQLGEFKAALALLQAMESQWQDSLSFAFSSALVYTLAGQSLTAVVEVESALEKGLTPTWFHLPWFDSLCPEPGFQQAMSRAGMPGRCSAQP